MISKLKAWWLRITGRPQIVIAGEKEDKRSLFEQEVEAVEQGKQPQTGMFGWTEADLADMRARVQGNVVRTHTEEISIGRNAEEKKDA